MAQRIINLPQEIFDSISDYLDINTILSLRCISKHFLKMTSSRHIWSSLAQRLRSNPRITKLEEPVEDYTASELKDRVLRHHKAQELLHGDLDAQFKKRAVLRSGVGEVKLLPGGRWLVFIRGSNMFFVDCDTASLEPQELISTEAPTRNGLNRFTTWIDLDAPRLAFRVAMIHWEKMKVDISPRRFWVMFYDVKLVGHGSTAGLVSKVQGQGRQYSGTIICNTHFEGLNNDYLIQLKIANDPVGHGFDSEGLSLQVVDYKNTSSSLDLYEVNLEGLHPPVIDLYMLPGNRFVTCDSSLLFVYPIPKMGTKDLTPLHTFGSTLYLPPLILPTYFRSGLYIDEDSTSIVYRAVLSRSIIKIVIQIPHDGRNKPKIGPVAETDNVSYANNSSFLVCLWSTVGILKNRSGESYVEMSNHSWSDLVNKQDVVVKKFCIKDVCGDRIRAFDEGIGRMVVQDTKFGDTTIFDVIKS